MKTPLMLLGYLIISHAVSAEQPALSSNELYGNHLVNTASADAVNTAINPPHITFSQDTLNGGGTITMTVEIDDPDNNFSFVNIIISNPSGITRDYNFSDYNAIDGKFIAELKIYEYDAPGYWYVISVNTYYADGEYVYNAAEVHSGFYVINTHIDETPPGVRLLEVSKDTAFPGDTVLIRVEMNGTGSGLSTMNISIADYDGIRFYFNGYHDDYPENKKTDTLLFSYIIGNYEMEGKRRLAISVSDLAGNLGFYTEEDLDFRLVVTGTTEDSLPPDVKNVEVINHSPKGEIWLEVVVVDDISGINNFSVSMLSASNNNYYSYYYYPIESTSDFIKINDSLYRYNILTEDLYLTSGNYQIDINLTDNANNNNHLENYQNIFINNVNSDAGDPEIISVTYDKDTVIAGELITVSIVLSDDKSGLERIYGSLDSKQGRQSIYYDHDYGEPGIRYDTLRLSFKLPEFGPSGLWAISIMSVYDYSGKANNDWFTERPTFYYFSKFVDTIPPVFKSMTIAPKEVYAGDTVTVTVSASDNLSGIQQINYYDDYINASMMYYLNTNTWFMSAPDTYKIIIPVNRYAISDTVAFELNSIADAAGNDLYLNLQGPAYKIISSGEIDTVPPVFDSLTIADTLIGPEDTLSLIFYLHDDISGIYPDFLYAFFGLNASDLTSSDIYEYFDFLVFPNHLNGNQYGVKLPADVLDSGSYILSLVYMMDMAGNIDYPYNFDYQYLARNCTFRVSGIAGTDTDDPVLESISITPEIVQPGDTVSFEIKVVEKSSGIPVIMGNLLNTNGIDMDILLFNDWEITESNDTFICRTQYVIPGDATNGLWILDYLTVIDYFSNEIDLEYGVDYFIADFTVTGGHSYPNRPPTWVIPEINLTVDAGNQLIYKIPDYIINDIDGDLLGFSAVMANGNSLLSWMDFSAAELRLAFNPVTEDKGNYSFYVIASDPGGLSDSIPVTIRVKSATPINPAVQQPAVMKIFPNPAVDFIYIDRTEIVKSVALYDLRGKKVYENHTVTDKIDISGLEAGLYILTIETDRMTMVDKINVLR